MSRERTLFRHINARECGKHTRPSLLLNAIDVFPYSLLATPSQDALHFARSFLQEASIFILHNAFIIAACTLYLY